MKIKISKIEEQLGKTIKRNTQSIGMDIAERCGICIITTDETHLDLDWQFIEFDKTNINSVYKGMFNEFSKIIIPEKAYHNVVVIEDTFLKFFGKFPQVDMFKKLTRFGTIALVCCFLKEIEYNFILAKSARSKLKIKMKAGEPKESVARYLHNTLDIKVDDDDISDAIVLSILGLIEGLDYRSNATLLKIKKAEKKKAVKEAIKQEKKIVKEKLREEKKLAKEEAKRLKKEAKKK